MSDVETKGIPYPHTVHVSQDGMVHMVPAFRWWCGCGKAEGGYADERLCRDEALAHQQEHTKAHQAWLDATTPGREENARRTKLLRLFQAMMMHETVTVPDKLYGGRREGFVRSITSSGTVFVSREGKKPLAHEPGEVEVKS